jgi:hypothetical protein
MRGPEACGLASIPIGIPATSSRCASADFDAPSDGRDNVTEGWRLGHFLQGHLHKAVKALLQIAVIKAITRPLPMTTINEFD